MKYRRLSNDELDQLKDKFIQFLVSNTVTADDWVKIKEQDITKADSLIELFSDIVFEDVLKNVQYLEFRTSYDLKIFHCTPDMMFLKGIKVETNGDINFLEVEGAEILLEQLQAAKASTHVYKAEKQYTGQREKELFEMMERGCFISKEECLFEQMEKFE